MFSVLRLQGFHTRDLGWIYFFFIKMIFCLHFFLLLSNKYLTTVGSISHQELTFRLAIRQSQEVQSLALVGTGPGEKQAEMVPILNAVTALPSCDCHTET